MNTFSHLDNNGKINMVDINHKTSQTRIATATGKIFMSSATIKSIKEMTLKKGDLITTAKIAGIQAAKQTPLLIPLCHQLNLEKITVEITLKPDHIQVNTLAKSYGKTGVEIEALTSVQITLLTIYDMCKAIDKEMIMSDIKVVQKEKIDD